MQKVEVVIKFIKHMVWGLIFQGTVALVMGLLIFIYPELLGMLVGLALVVAAIAAYVLAYRVNKLSSFKVEI